MALECPILMRLNLALQPLAAFSVKQAFASTALSCRKLSLRLPLGITFYR